MSVTALNIITNTGIIDYLTSIRGYVVLTSHLLYLLEGALLTLKITALSVFFGMILGLIFGLFKLSGSRILRFIAAIYIDFFRGTPLFVQILLMYFGVLPLIMDKPSPFEAAVITCSINSGAYIAEIVRAGIQAVDKGQMEAARSLGMNYPQAMWMVILPQAYKIVIPPLINEFIMLLKDTSLVSAIAAEELTQRGRLVYSTYYEAVWVWGGVAMIYLVMTKVLSILGEYTERRLATE
ncbi:MAG: amino acid ABC transporter permease [Syntrophomonadaceae bacterium]|jgi:polar amino acid transport system permease protein|nr:amino acid ABC transporter permease [Syntrophomonadaceae bacterium]